MVDAQNDPIHRAAEVDVEYRADADGGSGAIACYLAQFLLTGTIQELDRVFVLLKKLIEPLVLFC